MAADIRVGNYGGVFRATVKDEDDAAVDISGATTKEFRFLLPDGTTSDKSCAFYTDGTDGILDWVVTSGFIDQAGSWWVEAHVVTPTKGFRTDAHAFEVKGNI